MSELSETVLENRECLEQLRALEYDLTIGAIETKK
jgi:CMP-2-keto-3-deoxyoctulosonic acid synthetase